MATADPEKKKRRVSVLERRLQNPFGEPSAPVRLKDPSLIARWFNSSIRPDQFWRAKELGWTGVTPEQIADLQQIGHHVVSPDGYVARGERANEVLMCMPKDDYKQIQVAKTKKNLQDMKDFDKEKQQALNAFAKQHGGTAAEFVNDRMTPIGGVRTTLERIQVSEEAENG